MISHATLLLGLILIVGLAAGRMFGRVGLPKVVAFIVMGVLFGDSFSHLIPENFLNALSPLTTLALALIGFMVGGEPKHSVFKKYGKQFLVILLSEGMTAMLVVFSLCMIWTRNAALSILLGALSAATAPAATVDVLWEYHSRGPLTSTVLAVVALDDGLSLILYGFALAFADVLVVGGPFHLMSMVIKPMGILLASGVLGVVVGLILDGVLKLMENKEDRLIIVLGAILVASGVASYLGLSLILANMVIGLFLTNIHAHRNEGIFDMIRAFTPPIYLLFFVFIGARLQIGLLPKMGLLGILYVCGRTIGKWSGSYIGARISGAPDTVRRYLGLALFSQAGVAIGLALDIYDHFVGQGPQGVLLGQTVINVITSTTFVVQIIGPPSVKLAITKAGEIMKDSFSEIEEVQ